MNIQTVLNQLKTTMTDAEIGEKIGAPQSTVTRLRNGKHKTTYFERAEAIRKLAEAHNINTDSVAS
ncbi:helix-turn-helix transcriptional regulator [Methylomonas montana]|uniref:helix-turn-helix domain-containing protein n=1 Tax=Methylomonas montana TaxID=3058963 RepID=UPI002658DE33|nr:helix-turn-helix transcriptional regulator [Methylomonas montana]WKJ88778.1 helix-turn-helix transcriptional regulator [Methylomonas montana]